MTINNNDTGQVNSLLIKMQTTGTIDLKKKTVPLYMKHISCTSVYYYNTHVLAVTAIIMPVRNPSSLHHAVHKEAI